MGSLNLGRQDRCKCAFVLARVFSETIFVRNDSYGENCFCKFCLFEVFVC